MTLGAGRTRTTSASASSGSIPFRTTEYRAATTGVREAAWTQLLHTHAQLVRPVEQQNSNAFAIMAVPDQMANSFLCQNRNLAEKTRELKPEDAKYGTYYLSANRLNYGEEESPALLLLWTKEKDQWKIVAWAVEVP